MGAILRLVLLDSFPPSLNWDEASLGYNAYSLLKTGADEWGSSAPLIFRAFGDFKLPGYVYALVPAIALFGLNPFSVRLISALAGTALIPIVYILAFKLLKNTKVALGAAFLVSISPWGLFLSRMAVEANLGILMATIAIVCLISGKKGSAILFFALSAWTYNTFRVFSPAFLILYSLIYKTKYQLSHYVLVLVLFIPIFGQLLSQSGSARFASTSILDSGAINKINQLRARPGGRLVYNKLTYFAFIATKNYVRHFSPDYLFTKGTSHYQFSIPNQGLFYIIFLPFLYIGGFISIKKRPILLLWLLLAPLGASLTRDVPHTLRSISLFPLYVIFISSAISAFGKYLWHAVFVVSLVCLYVYSHNYFTVYPKEYSWVWQFGHQELVTYIKNNQDSYDEVIMTKRYGEPHIFFNFYWPISPNEYQTSSTKIWDYHASWYWVDAFAKFRFVNDWEMPEAVKELDSDKRYLIVSSPENPSDANIIHTVKFLDQKAAFYISAK